MPIDELLNYNKVCDVAIDYYQKQVDELTQQLHQEHEENKIVNMEVELSIAKLNLDKYKKIKKGIVNRMIFDENFAQLSDDILLQQQEEEKSKNMVV